MKNIELTEEHFQIFKDYVFNLTGINLSKKKVLLHNRLYKRLNKNKITCFKEYFDYIKNNKREFYKFLSAVTTNTTYFFREPEHFTFLKEVVIPEKFQNNKDKIKFWSCASSKGKEVYSIIMTLLENNIAFSEFEVLGTDISNKVLKIAENGEYFERELKGLSPYYLNKYFIKKEKKYIISDELRKTVEFDYFNLYQDSFKTEKQFDVIFCRNVFIYFNRISMQKVFDNIIRYLKKGGYFIIGHSESLISIKHNLKNIKATVYKKQ